ncbi:MAG: aspartate/glutamate racemase family protein [Pseudomonadales bacterium]|nr:aspartate/glutamate racemase family protein [Pseudomonadales bacterium]MDP7594099.1 aspartate/glutamate racemase family protein [Pseudomonadales bacterium]HJN50510.1 aspartate/glutamate racemase family protein [Pseudomonadales bacterium]
MKTIGLIGGMSWQSSIEYYRLINQQVAARLGKLHSAKCLLYSVDFHEMERLQVEGNWQTAADLLADIARKLEKAGADCLLLCTNTMHKVADEISAAVSIPLLHIADASGDEIRRQGWQRAGLLGTRFTMEETFYRERLAYNLDVEILIPSAPQRETIHRVIYTELCEGRILAESRDKFSAIVDSLTTDGAQGIVLGCTEIGLLLRGDDVSVPLLDSTHLHARAAVEWALK